MSIRQNPGKPRLVGWIVPVRWSVGDSNAGSVDWDDANRFVAKQKHRARSKTPNDADLREALAQLLEPCKHDDLIDLHGRGLERQFITIGSRQSRTSMSLHRKDIAVRAHHGVAVRSAVVVERRCKPSGHDDPNEPIWCVELRRLAERLHRVTRGEPNQSRRITPSDRIYFVSPVKWGSPYFGS